MRVGGLCLESAADVKWSQVFFLYTGFGFMTNMVSLGDKIFFSIAVYMEHFYSAFAGIYRDRKFSPHRGRTTDFDVLPSSTGNFLLLVHGLQTFDVLPSSTGNFPFIVDELQTFDVLSRRSA
ncbi:hypothetical protein TNCV_4196511 [Trichonephila clavipes]|nr:hypothetical protein TNCV_4196511 [Trichonephila clavipes]